MSPASSPRPQRGPSRRRFLTSGAALTGAALSGPALAGCGGQSADGPLELTFWAWAPEIEAVVALWNQQNPDVQVTVSRQEAGEASVTKLLTAVRAQNGAPDLVQAEYQAITSLVSADAIDDISDVLDPATRDHFAEGIWSNVNLQGESVYAIPQDTGPIQFYYRADVFDSLGLDAPETWEDYAEAARVINAADPEMYLGTFSSSDPGLFVGLAQQAGASWWSIDGDRWAVAIDEEPTQRVAAYWGDLVEEGVIDNEPMYTPQWNAALNNGRQVGWVSAVWAPGTLAGVTGSTAGQWRMSPIPQWDPAHPATGNWGGSATAVTTQTRHCEAAVRFAEWMNTSAGGVEALVEESAVFPADQRESAQALSTPPEFFSDQQNFYDLSTANAQTVEPFTFGPNVNVTYAIFKDAFARATRARSAQAFADAVTSLQEGTVADLENQGYTLA